MWTEGEPAALLIVSTSGRALAQSAARGDYRVTVLDGFCDADTRAVASCIRVGLTDRGLDADRVRLEAGRLHAQEAGAGLVYGSGLEGAPQTLAWMAERFRLIGNQPGVLELLADPSRFFGLLDGLGIPYPQSLPEPPPAPPPAGDDSRWLLKEAGTSGGLGVRSWRHGDPRPARPHYFQRFIEGPLVSLVFIADGADMEVIGVSRPRTTTIDGPPSFHYGGAVGQSPLSAARRARIEDWAADLVRVLGLRGLNNLDLVLHLGEPLLLELNPRPSATLDLYEPQCPHGWIRGHVRASLGDLRWALRDRRVPGSQRIPGQRVVYAPEFLVIPPRLSWPTWCHDRPVAGSRIAPGSPLCTLSASGSDAAQTERRLLERERRILDLVGAAGAPDLEAARP